MPRPFNRISTTGLLIAAGALAAALALAIAAGGEPAGAAFPGKNGKIAFSRDVDDDPETWHSQIWTMATDGSDQQLLVDHGRVPAFSSNGDKIAFERGGSLDALNVYTMNADGTNQRRVTRGGSPTFSPNGSWLAYTRNGNAYKIKVSGKGRQRLIKRERNDYVLDLAWSPNGKKIAYSQINKKGDDVDLYTMEPNGRKRNRLTPSPAQDFAANWSPNGKRIVFNRAGFRPGGITAGHVYTIDASGKHPRKLTKGGVGGPFAGPAFSPDGKQIVFVRELGEPGPGEPAVLEIFGMNADGSDVHQLTGGNFDDSPDWQPR